jgi:hypothetical protein
MKKAMLCAGVISAVTVANTNNGVSAATASSLSSLKHNVKQNQGGGKERVLSGKKNEAAHSSAGDLQTQKSSSSEGDDVASLSFGGGKKRAQQQQQQQQHFEQQQLQHREGMNTHLETKKAPLPSSFVVENHDFDGRNGVGEKAADEEEEDSKNGASAEKTGIGERQQQLAGVDENEHKHKQNFVEFMRAHDKNYCPENKPSEIEKPCSESIKREKIFETNLLKMNQHNAKSGKAFGMRVTEFADLTQEEFIAKHLTYKSWKKEQMEIAANRAGRQPDDPKVEIPAEAEKSFEKAFGKLEKAVEDESVNAPTLESKQSLVVEEAEKQNANKDNNNDNNDNNQQQPNQQQQQQNQDARKDAAVKQNNNNNKDANRIINEAKEGHHESHASSDDDNSYENIIGEMFTSDEDVDSSSSSVGDDEYSSSTSLPNDRASLLGVDNYPEEFSWTDPPEGWPRDLVGEVHDQRDTCASCWAFVSADSIAARAAVMTKDDIVILSVKQLMNCDSRDHGCNTGNMYTAYMYVDESGGIASKDKYDSVLSSSGLSFTEEDQDEMQCMENVEKKWTTPGMCDIAQTEGNDALMKAIYEKGPVAIGINANNLQMYDEGVIKFDDCGPAGRGIASINHAALVVGWGIDHKYGDTPYWLVKNSYGTSFGEDGYFKLERGPKGPVTLNENQYDENGFSTCGLLFESVYPVVRHADDDGGAELGSDETCTTGSYYKREYRRDPSKNPGVASTSSAALSSQLGEAIANGKETITELDMIKMWDEQMRDTLPSGKEFTGVAPLAGAMAATLAVVAGIARKARKLSAANKFVDQNAGEDSPLLMNKAVVSTQ